MVNTLLQNCFQEWEVSQIFLSGNCFLLEQQGFITQLAKTFSCPFTWGQGVPNQAKI